MPAIAAVLPHAINGSNPRILNLLTFRPKRLFSSPKLMLVNMSHSHTNKNAYWASTSDEIDAHLKQAIPLKPPLTVFEPMHDLTFAAPRTAAPVLCIAACELVGGRLDQAIAAASAFRLIRAAAFTHEHLPSALGSGGSHMYGPNIELLTGDALLPFGLELLASSDDPAQKNSDRILRVIAEITRAMGSEGVVYGQWKELQYRESNAQELVRREWIEEVCKRKEGQVHACAGACGAILGGGSEEEVEKLRRFGLYVGMIRGLVDWSGGQGVEEVDELRKLALQEVQGFNGAKVGVISSFLA